MSGRAAAASSPQAPATGESSAGTGWDVTHAHTRTVLVLVAGALLALIFQRPDVVVLISPILVVLLWSTAQRPRQEPEVRVSLDRPAVTEGQATSLQVRTGLVEHADLVAVSVRPHRWLRAGVGRGAVVTVVADADREAGACLIRTPVEPIRWGRHHIGPTTVGAVNVWASYRWGPHPQPQVSVRAYPAPAAIEMSAAPPHPVGLVGAHSGRRQGDGNEFAAIRPFQWGDRLKRIHWGRSLRTGELHVSARHADMDTHVSVIVDAHYNLGRSEGVHGQASTLDSSVRAATAISRHFLRQGDRVSLEVWSGAGALQVAPGSGVRHHRRVVHSLSMARAATASSDRAQARYSHRSGATVVMLSPMVSGTALRQAAQLAGAGRTVVILDMLGDHDHRPDIDGDAMAEVAWRIRMLERRTEIRRIHQYGVVVLPWTGSGTLDTALRLLARRPGRG